MVKATAVATIETTKDSMQSGTSKLTGRPGRKASMLMKWVAQTPVLNATTAAPMRATRRRWSSVAMGTEQAHARVGREEAYQTGEGDEPEVVFLRDASDDPEHR